MDVKLYDLRCKNMTQDVKLYDLRQKQRHFKSFLIVEVSWKATIMTIRIAHPSVLYLRPLFFINNPKRSKSKSERYIWPTLKQTFPFVLTGLVGTGGNINTVDLFGCRILFFTSV